MQNVLQVPSLLRHQFPSCNAHAMSPFCRLNGAWFQKSASESQYKDQYNPYADELGGSLE